MATAKTVTVDARKAEANDETPDIEFEFDGETYTIAGDAADDLEVMEAFEDGNGLRLCRLLLGDVQWAKFKRVSRDESGKVRIAKVEAFTDAIINASEAPRGN